MMHEAEPRAPGALRRCADTAVRAYQTHRDFIFLLALFAVMQLMLLVFFAPGGYFSDYSDYWYYEDMAARMDSGYYPYVHYWVEYPPLFPWLPVGAYWLSRLLPPAPQPQLWFYVTFGALMALFAVGNLVLVYLLGLRLYDRARALRCSWFYALLFGAIFVHAGWFDGSALFFLLLSLYLLVKNRAGLSGLAAGLGMMIKVLPLVLVPVGLKILPRRIRYVASLGLVIAMANLPFLILNPSMFIASWRGLLSQPSWETIWALLDGYYSYGLVTGNRFDPAQAGGGQRPEFVPWLAVLVIFGLVYLLIYLLPWQQRPENRARVRGSGWFSRLLDQFRHPALVEGSHEVHWLGVVAFVGLSLNLFMIFSRGYSPQFLLWYLPFLVLALPNGWGLAYATLLTVNGVLERILYFFVLPDATWLIAGTVLFRTGLMLMLVPEYLAVMGFLQLSRWRKIRRWMVLFAALVTLVAVGWGVRAFVRDYTQQRYAQSPQRPVVDRIRTAALPGDGVVITSRTAFDAVAPFLPEQDARLFTRDDGEFRPAAFEEQWANFVMRHPRMWLMLDYAGGQNADWNGHLAELLGQNGFEASDEWVGEEQRLILVASAIPAEERVEDVSALFGAGPELERVALDAEPLSSGDILRLTMHWRHLEGPDTEYKVFLHLISEGGQIHAQRDVPLESAGRVQRVGMHLPPGLAPGAYHLRIGVYDPATGDRLLLSEGEDSRVIEGIRVR
ncbi:glycosyltransferase 87 family protein [Chloroflexota bacterium]